MGYVYKYSSSKEIVNNVFRDLGLNSALSYDDCINYIYRCLELIQYPAQYIPKILGWKEDSALDFTAYIFPLPCDFHSLNFLSINGQPTRPSDEAFLYLKDGNCCFDITSLSSSDLVQFQDNFGNEFSTAFGSTLSSRVQGQGYQFNINSGIVTTNVKEGKACLSYYAIPIDPDGFPLVPDNEKVKRALEDFIKVKLLYREWVKDADSRGKRDLYLDAEKEYTFTIGAAMNDLKMPEIGEMENIKNSLIRMKPRLQEYNNFWNSLSNNVGHRH